MKKAILIIYFITIYFISNAQDEWTMINPYPTISNLLDAHFISEQKGWVVGTNGTIMFTADGGISWDIQHSNPNESLWSIFFIDDKEGWSVGWSSIYHTTNAGNTWEKQNKPYVMGDLTDVYFVNQDTGWIVGTYKIVLKTTDGGENWTKIMNTLAGEKCFYSVSFTDELHGCGVGGKMTYPDEGFIMVTNDGGLSWTETTPLDSKEFTKIIFPSSETGWVCGQNGGLLKTQDGGITWIDKSSSYSSFQDIHFFDNNYGIVLASSLVYLTFDGGDTWDSVIYIGSEIAISSFSSWGYNEGISVGYNCNIGKTLDGGNTWELLNSGISLGLRQIGFFNSLNGLAISGYYQEVLYQSMDGGYTWEQNTTIDNGPFYMMKMYGSTCYLLNKSSGMMKTINAGETWELLVIPADTSVYNDLQFVNQNTAYMCSSGGILVKSIDGGNTWQNKSLLGKYDFQSLFFINEDKGWLINYEDKTIFRTQTGGNGWTFKKLMSSSNYIYQPEKIFFTNENEGYATTKEGVLFSTLDGGDNWDPFYVFSNGYNSNIYFDSEHEGWYTSASIIYHTRDGGLSWTNDQTLAASIYDMYFLNNLKGWICGANGLIATYNSTVDINEIGDNLLVSASVFPNPAHNEVEVKLYDVMDKIIDIRVFNMQGQKVKEFKNLSNSNSFKFNVSELTSGAYIVNVTSTNSINLVKLIVQ